jgi:hypothetical protein
LLLVMLSLLLSPPLERGVTPGREPGVALNASAP